MRLSSCYGFRRKAKLQTPCALWPRAFSGEVLARLHLHKLVSEVSLDIMQRKTLDFDFKVHLKSILSVASSNLGFGYLVS